MVAGGTTSTILDIQNLGNRDLVWMADEAPPAEFHFPYGPRYAPSTLRPGETDVSAAGPSRSWLDAHGHARKPAKAEMRARPASPPVITPSFACNITSSSSCDFVSFDASAPGTLDTIASENERIFSAAFANNDFTKEYVVGYPSGDLETIDTTTGARATVGPTGQGGGVRAMAFDAVTGAMFGTAIDGTATDLFTVDMATGAMSLVGPITGLGAQSYVMGLAVDPGTGLMYGIEIVSSSLVAIDKTTGAASTIGALGYTTRYSQGLDFDAATGVLYLASIDYSTGSQNMYTVDTTTGAASLVGPIGNNVIQMGAFGIAVPPGPCLTPTDQPWLSINPAGGTTVGGSDTPVTVTIDATNSADGDTLSGTVCVRSNDPDEPTVAVPVSMSVTGTPPPVAPTVSKSFSPAQVAPGIASTLTITLGNTNASDAALTAPLVDAFPNGLVVADTPNAQTTCGGNVTAAAATGSVMLDNANASIPANGACTITVDVVSAAPNAYANDIPAGALQTDAGPSTAAADATLTVAFVAPTLTKAFVPSSVTAGTPSTLTLTLGNDNGIADTLTGPLTDAFPAGLVVATPPNSQTTCGGAVTAAPGDASVMLSGPAVIPASGACTVSIDVVAAAPGDFANSIPADSLHTTSGANLTSADATLTATPIPPIVSKSFGPGTVAVNQPATLTITLGNANATAAVLRAPLVDTFPTDLVIAGTPNASTTCGGALTADPGAGSVTLDNSGTSIPGGGSCTISVDVESAIAAVYTNDIPADALQTDLGDNAAPADANLIVTP